jgi:hypothetical protein
MFQNDLLSKTRYIQIQTALKFWKRIHRDIEQKDEAVQVGQKDIDDAMEKHLNDSLENNR